MSTQSQSTSERERLLALEFAADRALRAPSVHNTQPWRLDVEEDRVSLRADRTRQLPVLDPRGRQLLQSCGAALFHLRVALAARCWAAQVQRLPDPGDPDLLAVVRALPGQPEADLAPLEPAISRRSTNRRRYGGEQVPDDVLRRLADVAAAEDTELLPVLSSEHRRLVARLTQEADRVQNADPAYRAELRRWTTRPAEARDGVPAAAVAHVDGAEPQDIPLRDFDTQGGGGLPADTHSDVGQTLVLLTTSGDDPAAWLRSGEALERVLLELTELGYVASPVTQAIEVPLTRSQLRSALSWGAHPQMLLRIGHASHTPASPRRPRADVVRDVAPRPAPPAATSLPVAPRTPRAARTRPVPDGRGGTTWE